MVICFLSYLCYFWKGLESLWKQLSRPQRGYPHVPASGLLIWPLHPYTTTTYLFVPPNTHVPRPVSAAQSQINVMITLLSYSPHRRPQAKLCALDLCGTVGPALLPYNAAVGSHFYDLCCSYCGDVLLPVYRLDDNTLDSGQSLDACAKSNPNSSHGNKRNCVECDACTTQPAAKQPLLDVCHHASGQGR